MRKKSGEEGKGRKQYIARADPRSSMQMSPRKSGGARPAQDLKLFSHLREEMLKPVLPSK
jgi:hypothetical protein